MKKTIWLLNSAFLLSVFTICNSVGNESTPQKIGGRIAVVVIDPGHGGKDPGTVSGKAMEKNIVLDIGLKLGKLIQNEYPDIKVIYTRSADVFVPLSQRAVIANKNKADVFISLHANSAEKSSVEGTETFVLGQHRSQENLEVAKKENSVILLEDDYTTTYEGFDPASPESYIMFELVQDEYLEQSVMLASSIQDQFRERAERNDRSVKQAGFLVLRRTTMPGVLVETGFLSHTGERNYLLSEQGRNTIAKSIFKAFSEYREIIEKKNSFNLVTGKNTVSSGPENPVTKIESDKSVLTSDKNGKSKGLYFSVQIASSQRITETIPANFNGEKNIFMVSSGKIHRYFSGKFSTYDEALAEKTRLENKFKGAFVVAFENEQLISVKKVLEKM